MEKKRNFTSDRLILQYALRYGTVILVTVALVLLLVSWLMSAYKEMFVERVREELHEAVRELDGAFQGQYNLAKEISISSKASGSYITQSQLAGMEGIAQLETYRKTIADTCDYLFVSYTSGELFSNTGSATISAYLERKLMLEKNDVIGLEEQITGHQETMEILRDCEEGHWLVWLYPVNQVLEETRAVVGFVAKDETLREFFRERFEKEPLYAVMADPEGEPIFELCHLDNLSEGQLEQLRLDLVERGKETINGYAADRYESANGYVFYFAVPEDYIFSDFYRVLYGVLFGGILIFLVVLVLVFMVNNIHVRQIRNVRDVLLEYQDEVESDGPQNEFEQIHSLIGHLYQRQLENEARRRQMYRGASGQMARLLFEGHIEQEELLGELATQLTPGLSGAYFAVASCFFRVQNQVLQNQWEAAFLTEYFPEEEFPVCLADNFKGIGMVSVVIGLRDKDTGGMVRTQVAQKLLKKLEGEKPEAIIVIGKAYEHLTEVRKSYDEMLSLAYAVLAQENWGEESVFIFDIALRVRKYRWALENNIRLLERAIRQETYQEISHALENVMADINRETEPLAQKYSYYVLIQALRELLEELGDNDAQLDKLIHLSFEDAWAFEQGVLKIIRSMKAETEYSVDAVMQYINENFRDSAMGLDALAARFHMSVSAVSKKIKEQTGYNYTEHVSRLRIEEACRLLKETDLSIQEITCQVGYSDYVSFSKKFKVMRGMSPGEYRKRQKENKDE